MESGSNLLKVLAQVAGIGGIGLGLVFLIFRETLRKSIFPQLTQKNAYSLLRLIIILATAVGLAGLAGWIFLESREDPSAFTLSRDFAKRAKLSRTQGRLHDAVELFQEARLLDPTWIEPVLGLAGTYKEMGDRIRVGQVCFSTEAHDKAFDHFREVNLKFGNSSSEASQFISWYLAIKAWEADDRDDVVRHLLQYVAHTPERDGVVRGRVRAGDGGELPSGFHLNIGLMPTFPFWECFWAIDGEFVTVIPSGD